MREQLVAHRYPDAAESSARERLLRTRAEVVKGWQALCKRLEEAGDHSLTARIERFMNEMPPVRSDTWLTEKRSRSPKSPSPQSLTERTR